MAPTFYDSTSAHPMKTAVSKYAAGGRVGAKDGRWIQKATKNMRKDKPCTGKNSVASLVLQDPKDIT